jgi:hypothetical protein
MPTAQSRANLKYYHKRRAEDPEFADTVNARRRESYERNREVELARGRLYRERKRMEKLANTPAENVEAIFSPAVNVEEKTT